jgi:purine-binding chemotaxis protein CheW
MSNGTDDNDFDKDGDEDLAVVKAENQFVTFEVAHELFASPMAPVQEIIRVPELARMPLASPALLGLANLRGRVLPIVSLRQIFGLPDVPHTDATRALVIDLGSPMGFVVDRVTNVIAVDDKQLEPVSSIQSTVDSDFLTAVIKGDKAELTMVLDFAQVIAREFTTIAASHKKGGLTGSGEVVRDLDTDEEADSDELQLVSFTVDGQEYAADIAAVQEIVQVPERTVPVPNSPAHVFGLMTLRERLLPLVLLRALLGLEQAAVDGSQRIVVLGLGQGQAVGVVADSVDEVLRVPRQQVEPMPGLLARSGGVGEISSICRLDGGKRLVSVLDTARMFAHLDLKSVLAQANQQESDMTQSQHRGDEDEAQLDDEDQVVVFRLGSEEFGVPIAAVQEIVRVPESLTHVPKAPGFVEGVINLRGAVLPVIDQRRRLGLPGVERNDGQRIMVYAVAGMRTGFIVDAVIEVLKIPHAAIEDSPRLSGEQTRILGRVANLEKQQRMILLLDPSALLSGVGMDELATAA